MMFVIEGMQGLGDNIFQRIFIKAAAQRAELYVRTSWPELYQDLPVRFLKPETILRTQLKNARRQPESRWSPEQRRVPVIELRYRLDAFEGPARGIVRSMEENLPLLGYPFEMDLPDFGPWKLARAVGNKGERPIAVVRPVTARREWQNIARNPRPQYVAKIAAELMKTHYVVSVADIDGHNEWLIGEAPPAHLRLHGGEVPLSDLMALVQSASVVVGGVGWIVPASIAARVPAFIIMGGHGAHNSPPLITDPRMDLSRIGWAIPDNFCMCANMRHDECDKHISSLMDKFKRWRHGQGI